MTLLISLGVEIDCTSKQFKVKSVCALFRSGENAAVQPMLDKKDFFQFSLLGAVSIFFYVLSHYNRQIIAILRLQYNDSFNGRFTVFRGKKNIHDVARIAEIDGKSQMTTWLNDEEVGTDEKCENCEDYMILFSFFIPCLVLY